MKTLLNPEIAKLKKKGKIRNYSKTSPIQLILPILLIIVYLLLKKETKIYSPPPQSEKINSPPPQSENLLKFKDLLPKSKNKNFNSLDDIFKSRELFINDNNISNQYINYIKPFNKSEEINYQNKLYENEENFERFIKKRDDQYSYKEFIRICQDEKLIDFNIPNDINNPVISIIVSSYNKEKLVIKTIRSIQNQSFKNIEIIIVDDCSTDNSYTKYKSLLESDPRIRIFYHQKNMGLWRTRITGFLYSRGKYIVFFEPDDFYEDNYVLEDFHLLMNKFKLDSLKMIFRIINSYDYLGSRIPFHVRGTSKIIYGAQNIDKVNSHIFNEWGNIWNRITRKNLFIKSLNLLNDRVLNLYQNRREDYFVNKMINKASFSFLVIERVGYVYHYSSSGEGTSKLYNEKLRNREIQQFIQLLYFRHNLLPKKDNKTIIIEELQNYNKEKSSLRLNFFRSKFYILNDLINILIKDPYVADKDKIFLKQILNESHILENKVKSNYTIA